MALLVLAYPELKSVDYKRIQAFRKEHDETHYRMVEPHFTLVFPLQLQEDWTTEYCTSEIVRQSRGIRPFEFCIRCATLNKNAFNDDYHTFLVPDEGYSNIVKLHNKLYSDKLFSHWALDVDFIPHIRIGSAKDPLECLAMTEAWNNHEFELSGRVTTLDVIRYENDVVKTMHGIPLG